MSRSQAYSLKLCWWYSGFHQWISGVSSGYYGSDEEVCGNFWSAYQCHQILYFCCWTGNEFSSWHCGFLRYQHWNSSHTVLRNQLTTKSLTVDYEPLIDKIWDCMLCWTNRSLSFAGRLQLIKSVISNIVNFWSSVFVLPKSFYAKIDSLCAAFLWNNTTTSASGARVSWSDLCRPKAEGGLGIRLLEEYQEVFRLKRTWNYLSNNNSLWVGWVKNNVFHWSSFWVMADTPRFPPAIRSMIQLKPQLTNLLRCVLGNGETASFWYDSWTPLGPLIDLVGHGGRSTMRIREDAHVCEAVRDGEWYLPGARSDALQQMKIILTTIQPPAASDEPDKYLWIKSDGSYGNKFSTRVIWEHIRQRAAPVFWSKVVWFREYIPRYSFMFWLALLRRLPTKDRMRRWGMEVSETCVLCSTGIETHHHLFFECTYSSSIWLYFASQIRSFPLMDLNFAAA